MFITIKKNDVNQLKRLILAGANVNAQDTYSWTALHWAAHWGHLECLRELIQAGAHVNCQDQEGWTPLHKVARLGEFECLRELIQAGANVNHQNKEGWTPLHLLAIQGHLESLRELVMQGAHLGSVNRDGQTAKQVARGKNQEACATLLGNFELMEQEKKILDSDLEKTSSSDPFKQRKSLGL